LPELKPNKPFDEILVAGMDLGHKTLTHEHLGTYSEPTPPPSPILKPKKDEEQKSIYN